MYITALIIILALKALLLVRFLLWLVDINSKRWVNISTRTLLHFYFLSSILAMVFVNSEYSRAGDLGKIISLAVLAIIYQLTLTIHSHGQDSLYAFRRNLHEKALRLHPRDCYFYEILRVLIVLSILGLLLFPFIEVVGYNSYIGESKREVIPQFIFSTSHRDEFRYDISLVLLTILSLTFLTIQKKISQLKKAK